MSSGQLESLDHYGPASWDLGAEEDDFGGWSWKDWDRMAWEGWDTVQPAHNTVEMEGIRPPAADGRDKTTIRAWDMLELEIPEEGIEVAYSSMPPDLTFDPNTVSSTFSTSGTGLLLDDSPASPSYDRPTEDVVTKASSARDVVSSADQCLCDHPNCSQAFTHPHKLKYVRSFGQILFDLSNFSYTR